MAVDGMAARARRLAELEAAQGAREAQAHDRWSTLADRAAVLGLPIPAPVAGGLSAVLAARTRAIEIRGEALDGFESTLSDWRGALDRSEHEGQALARLRVRLRQTLADEVGDLSPAELSRLVARALGEHHRTGPMPPVGADAPPPAGVEQEAQLLGHLMQDDLDAAEASPERADRDPVPGALTPRADPTLRDRPSPDEPFGALVASGSSPGDPQPATDARAVVERAAFEAPFAAGGNPENDALVTMVSTAPADIGVRFGDDDPPPAPRRKLTREPPTDGRLSIDIDIEIEVDDDLASGEEALARWLGRPSTPPVMATLSEGAVDASIEALDGNDSLLEWEATGLGNEVAMLVERRRPAAARTSIIEVIDDPFDAFDDFDDSLDAPFGFVDNVTGQGPALADADWSLGDRSSEGGPETPIDPRPPPAESEPGELRVMADAGALDPRRADGPDVQPVPTDEPGYPTEASPDGSFEVLLLDDPFDDTSFDDPNLRPWSTQSSPALASGPSGSTDPSAATDVDAAGPRPQPTGPRPPAPGRTDTDDLLHGVDMQEAFPTIGAPLGADSMEEVIGRPPVTGGRGDGVAGGDFESALGAAFAHSAGRSGSADSLDIELDAAFAEQPFPSPPPARITDRPTARPRRAPTPRPDPDHSPPGGSLLPAPPDPGADGWGPRALAEQAALEAEAASAVDDDAPDHVVTDFGAALVNPAAGLNPFEVPLVTLPAPAPPMAGTAADSTEPGRSLPPIENRPSAPGLRAPVYDIELALAHAEATELPDDAALGDAHLTGLDWPPPRALHAFPDGSIDQVGSGDMRPVGPRRPPTRPTGSGVSAAQVPGADDASPGRARSLPVNVVSSAGRSAPSEPAGARSGADTRRDDMGRHGIDPGGAGAEQDVMSVDVMIARARLAAHLPADAIPSDTMPSGGHPRHTPAMDATAEHGIRRADRVGYRPPADGAAPSDVGDSVDSPSEPDPFGAVDGPPDAGWRSSAVAPSTAAGRSASLADALHAARDVRGPWRPTRDDLDAVLDGLEAPDADDQRRVTDRFAALAGSLAADPWASLDIPDHRSDAPDRLPELMRQRRQGRPPEPERALPTGSHAPIAEPEEESAPRAPLGVRVGLEAGDRFFTGFSRDISVDGIFVGTQHGLAVGEAVEVFFELPGGRSINARGNVRRLRRSEGGQPSGLGIRFEQLTREARVHIGRYVSRTLTGKIPLP